VSSAAGQPRRLWLAQGDSFPLSFARSDIVPAAGGRNACRLVHWETQRDKPALWSSHLPHSSIIADGMNPLVSAQCSAAIASNYSNRSILPTSHLLAALLGLARKEGHLGLPVDYSHADNGHCHAQQRQRM
jgi:hypothetical protein